MVRNRQQDILCTATMLLFSFCFFFCFDLEMPILYRLQYTSKIENLIQKNWRVCKLLFSPLSFAASFISMNLPFHFTCNTLLLFVFTKFLPYAPYLDDLFFSSLSFLSISTSNYGK